MTQNFSDEEFEFIAAAIENEAAEVVLDDEEDFVMLTDVEAPEEPFRPSVGIFRNTASESNRSELEQEISDLLTEEYEWFVFDELYIEFNSVGNGQPNAYFHEPRISEGAREYVEERI